MAHLEIRLLGSFRVLISDEPVTEFKSNKARALLAYLAVESNKQHHRSVLAGMLWPDLPEQSALSNLRDNVSILRKILGDRVTETEAEPAQCAVNQTPYLLVTRDTLQFNTQNDYFLDVSQFTALAKGDKCLDELEQALLLAEGDFLEGFSLKDSAPFERWVLFQREQIAELIYFTLRAVAEGFEQLNHFDKALYYSRRQLEYMPWSEETHRQLIRLYGLSGNMKQATNQYESCRRILKEEFGVEPEPETTALYEQVRDGKHKVYRSPGDAALSPGANSTIAVPEFTLQNEPPPAPLLGRSCELRRLHQYLKEAEDGNGRLILVSGEVGIGKTALIKEFCHQSMKANPELILANGVTSGHGEYAGWYMPLREIVQMVCGNDETRRSFTYLSSEQYRRLEEFSGMAQRVLDEKAPTVIERFLPPLHANGKGRGTGPLNPNTPGGCIPHAGLTCAHAPANEASQADFYDQFTKGLRFLSCQRPLLLVLDDLQWADPGTICLLHHLSRRLDGSRILVVGAFRSDEIAIQKSPERNPLQKLENELRLKYGDAVINLNLSDGKRFLCELLGGEQDKIYDGYQDLFYRLTTGNPLLATELLNDMKTNRTSIFSANGGKLPDRIEGMISEKISALPEYYQLILETAAAQGDEFTSAVVAAVLRENEEEVEQAFSGPLSKVYRLLTPAGLDWLEDRCITRYCFARGIDQLYLYNHLDEVRRMYLHAAKDRVVDALYNRNIKVQSVNPPKLAGWHRRMMRQSISVESQGD